VGGATTAGAVELRSIETRATEGGASVRLLLSSPTTPAIRGVSDTPGTAWRLYLDLPPGTSLGPGVRRVSGVATPPLARLRVGQGEAGVVRIVFELDGTTAYQVRRERGGRLITIALAARPEAGSEAVPVVEAAARRGPRPRIVLDPGHGGRDPGAEGFAVEKKVTLAIARRLAARLRERLGAETILTRTGDATLALGDRTARANGEGADLFVSIHANASQNHHLHGVETYYLNNTHDRATIRLAAMENGLGDVTPHTGRADLRYILSDLVQVGKMEESLALATTVQRGLVDELRTRYPTVADLGVKQGPFYVLVGAYMPCVLVETSFLTHPTEGRRLGEDEYQDAVAEGLYAGIARFLVDARRARTL
jgi:N-acetylmuramoyl-L-alanine amidase